MFNKILKIKNKNTKIVLEPVSLKHINDNYLNWFKDIKIKKFISYKPKNLEDLKQNVLKIIGDKNIFFYAIIVNEIHIGNIKIDNINFHDKSATIGILIGNRKFRNKGIGYQVINFIIKELNKNQILNVFLGCDKNNFEALNLYLKSGFVIISKNKNNFFLKNNFYNNRLILGTAQFNSVYGITNFAKKLISAREEKIV